MVRKAPSDDIEDLVRLVMEYREFYGVKNQDADEVRNFMKARLENGQSKVFVATEPSGEAVGFIQLYPSYSTVSLRPQWILNDLFVEPPHRRKGHGRALMARAKEYFCGNAKGFILLTEKSNATAKSFYENDGCICADYGLYTFFYG